MKRTDSRRLRRLEKQIEPTIEERERRELERDKRLRQAVRDHATMVVMLALHGNPRIDEPLRFTWDRALKSLALNDCPRQQIPERLRALVVADLPGNTENAKFANVFRSAPQWLLDFCFCVLDAHVLGFDLPRSSERVPEPGRKAIDDIYKWPGLPTGTLEAGGPILEPDLSPLDDLSNPFHALYVDELIDLELLIEKGEKKWSRQDRRRRKEIMAKVIATYPKSGSGRKR
jgi:hypothetical protein